MSEAIADSTDGQAQNQEANLEKPGALLKAARENEGLSVDEVAKNLYLTRAKVRALESDEYDKLQSDVFIKGYLRKYAPLVGLDAEKLVAHFERITEQFKQALADQEDDEEEIPSTLVPKFVVPAGLFGAAAVLAITVFVFIDREEEPPVTPVSEIDAGLQERVTTRADANQTTDELVPEPNLDRELANEALALAAREEATALSSSNVDAETVARESQAPNSAPASTSELGVAGNSNSISSSAGSVEDGPELRFEFAEDCWVEVRDHIDNLLYYDMAKAGENIELQGEPPFSMTLGNAQAVTLYWGDELIDTSPRPGNRTAKIVVGESDE